MSTGIIGMTELLLQTTLNNEQLSFVNDIKSSSEVMHSLVREVLDLSQIESGKVALKKEIFNLHELLNGISKVFKIEIERKKLQFIIEIQETVPEYVIGDSARILQIIMNLANNAIKFTNSGFIKITCSLLPPTMRENDCHLKISVIDTGKGIKPNQLMKIFQRHKSYSNQHGYGLGLCICNLLVTRMHGESYVKSKVGKGSEFVFNIHLKLPKEKLIKKIQESPTKYKLNETRVLIVEDSSINQKVLFKMLEKWKIYSEIASTGEEGFEKFKKGKFNIIIMDYKLPSMNGMTCTKRIRRYEKKNDLKSSIIICFTGVAETRMIEESKRNGCNEFLSKPITMEQLYNVLRKYIDFQ